MDRDLRILVLRENPWIRQREALTPWLQGKLPASYVPRELVERARPRWADQRRAHLVVGPRQAGKSTALWAHLSQGDAPVLFVDCEQPLVQDWCRSAPLFLDGYEQLVGAPVALFFDEVQHLDEAGLFIKGLVDRRIGAPIYVTGSSSYHLGARTRESLAGRATRWTLLPLRLAEVCADIPSIPVTVRQLEMEERFERHLAVGGYPDVWLSDTPHFVLADLVEAFVLRDASDLFKIERPDVFRRLLRLLARQVGAIVNYSEWASVLGVSRDTVASYLGILEESHIVTTLRPYAGGKRSELTSRPKVYLVDNGLRNHLVGDLRPIEERADSGAVMENWVYTELAKALPDDRTLHFRRSTSGAEVDFVVAGADRPVAVEVKAGHMARPRLSRSSRSFVEAYRPSLFVVACSGLEHQEQLGDTTVRWTSPTRVAEDLARAVVGSASLPTSRPES